MPAQKSSRYVAVRDCIYKGRYTPSGTVVELEDGEKMEHAAFIPASEGTVPEHRTIFDPTSRLATRQRIAAVTAGIPERK